MDKKKTTALLLGLTLSLSGTTFAAAPATADDISARLAALENQQQQLEAQIKELKQQNAKLKQTNALAKSNRNSIKGVKAEQNRIQLYGFGRASWDNDNIKGYIDRNDNSRYYLDLKGKFLVNDKWNFNFESETNERYKDSVQADGTVKHHNAHDGDMDGVIQRVWAEGNVGQVHMDIGRRWRGLGFQNVFFGNESDGIVLSTPIPKSKLTAKAFTLSPTDKGYDFTVNGVGVDGHIGHGLQISLAVARTNIGRNDAMGTNYYDDSTITTIGNSSSQKPATLTLSNVTLVNGQFHSGYLGLTGGYYKETGPNGLDKAIEAGFNGIKEGYGLSIEQAGGTATGYISGETSTQHIYKPYQNTAGSFGYVISAMWNPLKNIFLIGDYARTNAKDYTVTEWGASGRQDIRYDRHDCMAFRVNYRWSNINNPGSFQLYGRWFDYAKNINNLVGMFGDKEWGALQPGSKGWIFGFKYVPAKNIEWETFYEFARTQNTLYGHKDSYYDRKFVRTQIDYHF